VVVLVIVLSSPAGPDADQGNDNTIAAPIEQPDTANDPVTAPDGQVDPDAGTANDDTEAPTGQEDPDTASDNGAEPVRPVNPNPVRETILAPAGEAGFSIDLSVSETEPYAGIEFALVISDEDALDFETFAPSLDGAAASPFVTVDGKHYFGFYAGSNAFPAGDMPVGTLYFANNTSDRPLTVTVELMNVIRLNENNKAITTEKGTPAYVFTVQRETIG